MAEKEGKYGYYASGRPRPKPKTQKIRNPIYRLVMRWWKKAIERWRKGEVLVEKPRSMRAAMRSHGVGVTGHAKSSLSQQPKLKARFFTHEQVWIEGEGWLTQERKPEGISLGERRRGGN